MLPGARAGSSGDRTRLDRTSCPGPSMMMPNGFARWRIPGETGSQRAASRRGLARTGASRTQSGNDVRTTSPRLRGELRLTLDTLSHIRLCSSHLWRSIHCAGACNFFLDAAASDSRSRLRYSLNAPDNTLLSAIRWVRRCGELVQEIEWGCTLLACAEQ